MAGNAEDGDLARDASRGDEGALAKIVQRHYRPVWGALMRFTGDREAADTLTQEAFLKAIRSLGSFRGESRLGTWLTRIGLNLALNERRRKAPLPFPEREPAGPAPGPERCAEANETRSLVREAMAKLPEDLRQALLLTFFGGASHAEAGRELECAEGTVSWRVFEAKRRLKELLPDGL